LLLRAIHEVSPKEEDSPRQLAYSITHSLTHTFQPTLSLSLFTPIDRLAREQTSVHRH
jgi:hypothetical protein